MAIDFTTTEISFYLHGNFLALFFFLRWKFNQIGDTKGVMYNHKGFECMWFSSL